MSFRCFFWFCPEALHSHFWGPSWDYVNESFLVLWLSNGKGLFREKAETYEKVNLWASFCTAGLIITESWDQLLYGGRLGPTPWRSVGSKFSKTFSWILCKISNFGDKILTRKKRSAAQMHSLSQQVDRYSRYSPSPLSVQQFLDFGTCK